MTCARPGPRVLAGAAHRPPIAPNRSPTAPNHLLPHPPRRTVRYREFTIAATVPGTARIVPGRRRAACLAYHAPSAAHRHSPGARQPSGSESCVPVSTCVNRISPIRVRSIGLVRSESGPSDYLAKILQLGFDCSIALSFDRDPPQQLRGRTGASDKHSRAGW